MKSAFECFQRAAKCEEMALAKLDVTDKAMLLEAAHHWRTLGNVAKKRLYDGDRLSAQAALRREAWQAGQSEAFEAALSGAPLEALLGVLVRTAIEYAGGEARGAFYTTDENGTSLRHVTGMSEAYARCVDGFVVAPHSLACGLAAHLRRPVITPDVAQEPLWKPWLWLAEQFGYRACWSFPVETSANKAVGTFAMYYREPRPASPRDMEFAARLTRAAGIIIAHWASIQPLLRAAGAGQSDGVDSTDALTSRFPPDGGP